MGGRVGQVAVFENGTCDHPGMVVEQVKIAKIVRLPAIFAGRSLQIINTLI